MMTDEEFEEHKKWLEQKMEEIETANDDLAALYQTMTKEELRERFNNIDTNTLRWIVDDVALSREAFEACAVAKEILDERGEQL